MDMSVVRDVHLAINLVHRFVYFVPETAEEYGALGASGRGTYFASRAAPLGAVSDNVVLATFYNFSPHAVSTAMPGMWDIAPPAQWQAARFRVVDHALKRVGARVPAADIAAARQIVDPVVAALDLAGKPLAAANATVALPDDADLALWQQITVLREWRGDVHIAVLLANELGPCDCLVMQCGTGRFPLGVARATRQWSDDEWAAASKRLATRGWVDGDGIVTPAGVDAREQIEADTDRLCAPIWQAVGDAGASRLREIIMPIHAAMDTAGTYAALA